MHAIKMKYAKTITFYITDPVLGPNDEVGGGLYKAQSSMLTQSLKGAWGFVQLK